PRTFVSIHPPRTRHAFGGGTWSALRRSVSVIIVSGGMRLLLSRRVGRNFQRDALSGPSLSERSQQVVLRLFRVDFHAPQPVVPAEQRAGLHLRFRFTRHLRPPFSRCVRTGGSPAPP